MLFEGVEQNTINSIIDYAKTLEGVKFGWWTGQDIRKDCAPFWVGFGEVDKMKITTCSCTGLLNLISRKFGFVIPGRDDAKEIFPGGTKLWFDHLSARSMRKKNLVEVYDPTQVYEKGTLLFRPQSRGEQGHIALIITDEDVQNPLENKIIHSYPDREVPVEGPVSPGVTIEPIRLSQRFKADGFYKFVFRPDVWISD